MLADDRSLLHGGGGAQTPPRTLRFKESQLKVSFLHGVKCTSDQTSDSTFPHGLATQTGQLLAEHGSVSAG